MVCLFFPVWISVLTGCVVATAVEAAGLDVGMAWAALAEIHEERLRQEQQAGQPNTPPIRSGACARRRRSTPPPLSRWPMSKSTRNLPSTLDFQGV